MNTELSFTQATILIKSNENEILSLVESLFNRISELELQLTEARITIGELDNLLQLSK